MELLNWSAAPGLLTSVGTLALLTSAVTELTKGWGVLKSFPTDAQVLLTSLLLSLGQLLAQGFSWPKLPAALVTAVVAAFVAMYGWATFGELATRLGLSGDAHHE